MLTERGVSTYQIVLANPIKRQILLPGGTGYIGSHCAVELINAGYEPIILDNGFNSSKGTVGAQRRAAIAFHRIR